MIKLWVDDYRPLTLAGYVWSSPHLEKKAAEWIAQRGIPHLMFTGPAGTGKTTLARALLNEMGIPKVDILFINASKERKVDDVIERISNFCSTWSMNETGYKYVILDEADRLSAHAQDALKSLMELNSRSVRFILTTNEPRRITDPLHSRVTVYVFNALDSTEFTMRAVDVLESEKVTFDPAVLVEYVNATYPDLRKCIGMLQNNVVNGVLSPLKSDDIATFDYLNEMVEMYRRGEVRAARQMVVEKARIEEYPDIFRFFHRNLQLWASTDEKADDALLIIRDGLCKHNEILDPEINLAATLICLERLRK